MTLKSALSLMFQGTGSDVGKSLLVAGLCRAFLNRGYHVAPFKPQNMSNNAAVTSGGGEIGRAQALQAKACKIDPTTDMNPILLKPQSDMGSQLIVQGRVQGTYRYKDYMPLKPKLMERVLESYHRLTKQYDLVLVEGAGSAAEINLREGDIANMGFALAANVPVIMVADIDRGGVIASILGTHQLITDEERKLLKGYIINKFRGDVSLFDSALKSIYDRSSLDCFGIVPFLGEAKFLPDEDAMSLDNRKISQENRPVKISVFRYPRIANFDDLDPLFQDPRVEIQLVEQGQALDGDADLAILPGSKATLADLAFFKAQEWDIDLAAHMRRGGFVIGLCGGYQMLGSHVEDPDGIEGPVTKANGLGFIDMITTMQGPKTLSSVEGLCLMNNANVSGYEMHMGVSSLPKSSKPLLELDGCPEGYVSADEKVMGTYLHGLFHSDDFRNDIIQRISKGSIQEKVYLKQQDEVLDSIATHMEEHCKLDQLIDLMQA